MVTEQGGSGGAGLRERKEQQGNERAALGSGGKKGDRSEAPFVRNDIGSLA